MVAVFERSERATREWVGAGLDLDLTLLQLVMSDGFQATRFGTYLRTLPSHFEGAVVADMFCLLRIELELAVQAKAWLIAHEASLDSPGYDDLHAALAERAYLRRSIGRTGLLALEPLRVTSHRDYWHSHLLAQAGGLGQLAAAIAERDGNGKAGHVQLVALTAARAASTPRSGFHDGDLVDHVGRTRARLEKDEPLTVAARVPCTRGGVDRERS